MRFIDDANHQKGNQSKMNSKKIISLVSVAALLASSMVVPTGTKAASTPRARFSNGMFRNVVFNDTLAVGAGTGAQANTGTTNSKGDSITYLKSDFRTEAVAEDNDSGAFVTRTSDAFAVDRVINKEISAIWHDGYVGVADETVAPAAATDDMIMLQNVNGAGDGRVQTAYVGLSKTEGTAPNQLYAINAGTAGTLVGEKIEGVQLYSVAATAGAAAADDGAFFGLALDAKASHFTKFTGYIYAGDSATDDDGEYIKVNVAYPDAVLFQQSASTDVDSAEVAAEKPWVRGVTANAAYNSLYTRDDAASLTNTVTAAGASQPLMVAATETYATRNNSIIPYGGQRTFWVNKVITDTLPHDDWTWVLSDDSNMEIVASGENKAGFAYVQIKAKENATKGATAKLSLYNGLVKDKNLVYDYTIGVSSPNFYTSIHIRDDVNENATGADYADGTYTTNQTKVALTGTATVDVNEREAVIPVGAISWTWEKISGDEDNLIKVTSSGGTNGKRYNGNIATFEVASIPDTGVSATYLVKASGTATFTYANGVATAADVYGSRTVTVNFTKNATPEPTPEPEPTPAVEDGKSYVADNGTTVVTVASAADKIVTLTGMAVVTSDVVIPSTVEIDGTKYTVVAIDKQAFKGMNNIKSVTIPATVSSIGKGAFKKCKKLKTVNLEGAAGSVESLKNAFKKTSSKLTVNNSAALTSSGKKQVQKDNGSVSFK